MKSIRSFLIAAAFFASFVLSVPTALIAQLSDLPVNAGLWKTHVTTKIGERTMDAGPDQVCFTAGTTLGDYLTATNKSSPGVKCTVSNRNVTAHGISYDTTCTGDAASSKGHIDFHLTDPEHFSGTSNTTVSGTSKGKSVTTEIDKTFSAEFVSAKCGDVAPLVVPGHHSH